MFILKNAIFLELTKNQKSSLVTFLRNFAKKHADLSEEELLNKFIEDETYYYEVGNPHFEWILPLFENDKFLKEIKDLIKQYKKQFEEKEKQKPYLEKQKAYLKEQRKKAQEFKLSKEPPTEKQLKYYKMLCKRHKVTTVPTADLSRLDLKNMISTIIDDNAKKEFNKLL